VFEPNENYVRVYTAKSSFGEVDFRRMVYQNRVRMRIDPTFGVFDCPDGGQPAPVRTVSTTALRAAQLLNSAFALELSQRFARRIETESEGSPRTQAERGVALAFGRDATDGELAAAEELISTHGLAAFCRALFNANEFVYVD